MRKIILGLAVSLDGYIEGPNGEIDWCLTDQDYGLSNFFNRVDTLFMGRKTYELAQSMADSAPPGFPKMNEYIFSTTLEKVKEKASIIKGDIGKEVDRIRNEEGKDIWLFGGARLISSFINLDLVDEYWLSVHPVILGGGKPLFDKLKKRIQLRLKESKTYSTGLVSLTYLPDGN